MTVATNHGWEGKHYARTKPASEGMYEAVVYSNVEPAKQGRKFGSADTPTAANDFQYQLTNGVLAETTTEGTASLVGDAGSDQSAGVKSYKLPTNTVAVMVSGTFHGVSGTYSCTPSGTTVRCASQVAANDGAFTASAFVDEKGTVVAATGLTALNGTATYSGGATGKYALASSTGGTNDAGHFTARATLEADFTNNTEETAVSGTIDQFIGADGESRDWSVKLNGSQIGDTGEIGNASASTDVDTVWTIGDTAAAASGVWSGTLRNNGADLVPQVATGTFYTEYGTAGRMVGAFGANKQ